jgi:hypothetical protein
MVEFLNISRREAAMEAEKELSEKGMRRREEK